MKPQRQDELGIARQAAEWFTTLMDGGPREHAAFSQWLVRSPLHVQEFLNISAVHRMFDKVDAERRLDVAAMLRTDVVQVATRREPLTPAPLPKEARGLKWIAAAAAAASIAIALWWSTPLFKTHRYVTAVGEQRTVELDDGSLVYLNAASRVEVRFDAQARDIRLIQGEALFKVQRDPRHPFRVHTGSAVIQAIGTQFNVRQRARETMVSVIDGAVEVTDAAGTRTVLAAGEAARLQEAGKLATRSAVDTTRVTAWRQRRLVFEADTLEDMAAEFNRYNRAPNIRIEGNDIAQRRFTGVLDADNPESLLRILTEADDLAFEKNANELVIRSR